MEVHFTPETEVRLQELAQETGRPTDELVEEAIAGYLVELSLVRETLDGRYDDMRNGGTTPLDGEQAFAKLQGKRHEPRSRS